MNDQLAKQTETAAAIVVPVPASKTRALAMRATMEAETEMRAVLAEYVERNLREGSDFGKIPGTPKPTLLKPGAEKLVDLFHCEPHYEVTHRIEQWEDSAPLFHYEFRCKIVERESGKVLAEGFGSANSKEGRYRWRNGERKCPSCGKAAIIKGKAEYGGGFLCFGKKGGCGAKFADDAPEIIDQQVGKVENDDVFTLVNTILKMAKKRALVDGAIALARCSDLFTQDVEDMGGAVSDFVPPSDSDEVQDQLRGDPANRTGRSNGEPARRAPAPRVQVFPYGRCKGKAITDPAVAFRDLEWMADAMRGAVADPKKAQYAQANRTLLDALETEMQGRESDYHADQDAKQQHDDRRAPVDSDDIPF